MSDFSLLPPLLDKRTQLGVFDHGRYLWHGQVGRTVDAVVARWLKGAIQFGHRRVGLRLTPMCSYNQRSCSLRNH